MQNLVQLDLWDTIVKKDIFDSKIVVNVWQVEVIDTFCQPTKVEIVVLVTIIRLEETKNSKMNSQVFVVIVFGGFRIVVEPITSEVRDYFVYFFVWVGVSVEGVDVVWRIHEGDFGFEPNSVTIWVEQHEKVWDHFNS